MSDAGPGPGLEDYATHFKSPEYQNAKQERKRVREQNKLKRARKAALDNGGNINFRRDKLPGDPKI
jgi:hypothetical protein